MTLTSATGAFVVAGRLPRLGSNHADGGHGQYQCAAYEHGSPDVEACDRGRQFTVSSSSSTNLSDGFSSITIGNAAGTGAVTVNALTVRDPLTIRSPDDNGDSHSERADHRVG